MPALKDTWPRKPPEYTVATLPAGLLDANDDGALAYCSNAVWSGGTGCIVIWNGSSWRDPDNRIATTTAFAGVAGTYISQAAIAKEKLANITFANEIWNPNFENSNTIFPHFSPIPAGVIYSVVDAVGLGGTRGLQIDCSGQNNASYFSFNGDREVQKSMVSHVAGNSYMFSVWMRKALSSSNNSVRLQVIGRSSTNAVTETLNGPTLALTTEYQQFLWNVTPTVATTTYLEVRLVVATFANPGNLMFLDNVYFFPLFSSSIISDFTEAVQDIVGLFATDSTFIDAIYDDLTNTIIWTLIDGSITYTKLANINTGRLLGRSSSGVGSPEQISIGQGLQLASGVLSSTQTPITVSATAPSSPSVGDVWIDIS